MWAFIKGLLALAGFGEKALDEAKARRNFRAGEDRQRVEAGKLTEEMSENAAIIRDRNAGRTDRALVDRLRDQTGVEP